MGLKQLTAKEIADTLNYLQEIEPNSEEFIDPSDLHQFQTEVQHLEQHTGVKLHQLLEMHNV